MHFDNFTMRIHGVYFIPIFKKKKINCMKGKVQKKVNKINA